jgi:hypothetical protein
MGTYTPRPYKVKRRNPETGVEEFVLVTPEPVEFLASEPNRREKMQKAKKFMKYR